VVTGEDKPTSLQVDASHAYWTNLFAGTLQRAPLGGGVPETLAGSASQDVCGMALDATDFYWGLDASDPFVEDGTLTKQPKSGGSGSAVVLASGLPDCVDVVVDDQNVYWATFSAKDATRTLRVVGKTGGTPVIVLSQPSSAGSIYELAQDAGYVYWATGDAIVRMAKP
jgi:hypothetical protein